jgi:hypothetical protein
MADRSLEATVPPSLEKRFPIVAGIGAASIGVVVLIGWYMDWTIAKRIHVLWPSMKPNTAVGLIFAGAALALGGPPRATRGRRRSGMVLAAALCLIGGSTLASYVTDSIPSLDQAFFTERAKDNDSPAPGRMAVMTAFNFTLLGLALLALDRETANGHRPSQLMALAGISTCLVALFGYVYVTPQSHRLAPFSSVALHTAIALTLLWTGILAARAYSGFVATIAADTRGGALARHLFPLVLCAPVVLGWMRVMGERAGLFGWEYGVALVATATTLVYGALTWEGARWLNLVDRDRRAAQDAQALADERYRRFFEQNVAGACIVRPDGLILDCNAAFARIFGFESREEALATGAEA